MSRMPSEEGAALVEATAPLPHELDAERQQEARSDRLMQKIGESIILLESVALREALEQEAEQAGVALPEGDARKFSEYWRLYAGTRAANTRAEKLADWLLDRGQRELACAWYGRLRRDVSSPSLDARWAYARSLTSATTTMVTEPESFC